MGKQRFSQKKGFTRKEASENNRRSRKNRRIEDDVVHSPSPSSPDDLAEEHSDIASEGEAKEEIVVYKEPLMYDTLLKTLGSGSESLANVYKRRQREEEGKSDTDEDADIGSESLSASEEEDDGSDNENPESPSEGSNLRDSGSASITELKEDDGSDDDDDDVDRASDNDEEHDLRVNSVITNEESVSTSSFNDHLGYKLSKGEADNILERKLKYKWELPAFDMSNCKWIGTGERLQKDADVSSSYDIKPKLYKHWLDVYSSSGGSDFNLSKQRSFFSLCNSYWDILHHSKKPFYLKGREEDSSIMDAYLVHSLNHILRTRDIVTKNDTKVSKRRENAKEDITNSDSFLDHGFTRPKKIGEAEAVKEKDVDYLSSIEVLIIDHADVIAMQNWSHVNTVVEQLNRIPSNQHGTDIMRIRQWYLDGQAQFYRQTIILGSYLNPDINALFNHHCLNYRGKVKLACEYKGVLPKVLLQVRQIYERFEAESIVDADNARLEYFSKKVFPKIKDSIQGGTMIFISSYFEFVRVRNFLKSQDASFCLLGEYTKQSDISRARVWFFQGKRKIMLYTERAHFYHRYKIRGIQNLIIYSLPERKEFYPEIVNMLEGSHSMACSVLFSRFDQLRLERIVGSAPAKRMTTSEKGVFVFS